jgi:nitroreductase
MSAGFEQGLPFAMSPPLTISEDVARVLRERRTIGAFLPETPPVAVIDAALELATWAPNHRKTEPWRFYRLGSQTASALCELNAALVAEKKGRDAGEAKRRQWSTIPGWLVVTCQRSSDAFLQEEDYAACCCAVQNFALALWSAGLGTKWSTGDVTRHPQFFRLLDINPDEEKVVGLLWYGYPQSVPAQTRSPVAEFLRERP